MKAPRIAIVTGMKDATEVPKLRATFNSLRNLENFRWHIGISTDFSANLPLEIISSPKVKVRVTSDKSLYECWNKLLNSVSEPWVIFLGCGDRIHPNFDEWAWMKRLSEIKQKELVFGNLEIVDSSYKKIRTINNSKIIKSLTYKNARPITPIHPECFHRNFYPGWLNFNEHYKIAADYDLMLKYLMSDKIEYYDDPVSQYLSGGMSESPKYIEQINNEVSEILNKHNITIPRKYSIKYRIQGIMKRLLYFILRDRLYFYVKTRVQKMLASVVSGTNHDK